jgi:energy-coupling factor transporter transmembrane protein EcfT
MALESRGFSPGSKRTLYDEPRMTRRDYIVLGVLVMVLVCFLYLRIGLHRGVVMTGRL